MLIFPLMTFQFSPTTLCLSPYLKKKKNPSKMEKVELSHKAFSIVRAGVLPPKQNFRTKQNFSMENFRIFCKIKLREIHSGYLILIFLVFEIEFFSVVPPKFTSFVMNSPSLVYWDHSPGNSLSGFKVGREGGGSLNIYTWMTTDFWCSGHCKSPQPAWQ